MENERQTLVRFEGVSAAYGSRTVLRDVCLTVSTGDFVVLTGPNGGGKTTLVHLLLGLKKEQGGTLWRLPGLVIGYQPQYQRIDRQFPITVREIVFSGLHCRKPFWRPFSRSQREHVEEVLAECGLAGLADRQASELSGGQLQRVLFARAVVAEPDLLVLDEPDTYLDAAHCAELYRRLCAFRRHRAVVLVTHSPASIGHADYRTVYVDGTVDEPGGGGVGNVQSGMPG